MSVTSFAQTWEKPTISADAYTKGFKTSTLAGEEQGDTIIYYLYNIDAQAFLNGGAAPTHSQWSTNAILSDKGLKIMVTKYELSEVANGTNVGSSEAAEWDGKTYVLYDYWTNNKWLGIILTSATGSFIDRASQIDYKWEIIDRGNGVYRIKTADVNPTYNNEGLGLTESYFGFDGLDEDYLNSGIKPITPAIDMTGSTVDAEPHVDWAFISEADYEAYLAKQEIYEAAEDLKASIEYSKDLGISDAQLASYQAVYDNPNSTIDELKKASAAAYDMGRWKEIEPYFANIEQGKKNDVSAVFVNNDFEEGNVNGWDITYSGGSTAATNIGYQGASYVNGEVSVTKFIEAWKDTSSPNFLGDGSITQTIPSLPAGMYMLSVDAIVSNQGRIVDENNPNGYPDDVELFAEASLDGTVYKKDMFTKNGVPEHFEFAFIHTGGSMKLGLRVIGSGEARMPANWIAMDNLNLYYYGEADADPDKALLLVNVYNAVSNYPLEELDDVVAAESTKDAYKQVIEEALAATSGYDELITKVQEAVAAVNTSVEDYKNFEEKVAQWEANFEAYDALFANSASDAWGEFSDFIQNNEPDTYPTPSPEAVMDEHELTSEELAAYIEKVDELYATAFGESLTPGMDCSGVLTNASFADGLKGWTSSNGTFGGLKDYPCVEVYEGVVNVYQTIKGLPDGVYSLSCQAFERPAGNGSYDGTEASKVFLYMNEHQTGVQNILKDAMPEDEAVDLENCFINGGAPVEDYYDTGGTTNADYLSTEGYVPNGMSGASYAFRAGRYVQKVYGLVKGGELTIGLTSNGQTAHWVLWSKFQFVYEGAGTDATSIMLNARLEEIEKYVESNQEEMTEPGVAAAESFIDKANKDISNNNAEAMEADIEEATNVLAAAQENVAALKALYSAADALEEAINEYADMATDDAVNAASAAQGKLEDVTSLTTEEVKTLTEEVNAATAALKVPAYTDASDENPVDMSRMIVNSTFDTIGDFTGWSSGFGAGGTTSTNAECYEKIFDVYQDIVGLPAGTYQVSVQGYYRQGSAANDYTNTQTEDGTPAYNAYIYALGETTDTCSAPIMSICAGMLPAGLGGATSSVGEEGYVVPNTMESATYWFDTTDDEGNAIYYVTETNPGFNAVVVKVGEDGKLRIGVKKDVTISTDWAIFDNFKLVYYGANSSKEPTISTEIESVEVVAPVKANGKYFENGKIVIIKNGVKYNVAGQAIK